MYIYTKLYSNFYVYIINCNNDKKSQRFYNNKLSSYNSYRNDLLQYKVTLKCFIYFVNRVNCAIFDNP